MAGGTRVDLNTERFHWSQAEDFVNRLTEHERLKRWWSASPRQPLALLGRRRVGKSWLLRRFAHGRPAVILVAEQLPLATQLARFSDALEPLMGVRPHLRDVGDLITLLHTMALGDPLLVIIDEFPYLLGSTHAEIRESASRVQAALETAPAAPALRLILCGSQIGQMEAMFTEQHPLHGRLERMEVRPLSYSGAQGLLAEIADPIERFERFCVAGGMPMYLSRLGRGTLREAVCTVVLDRFAPLWNEGRSLIEQELREPRVYFALLERLARGPQRLNEVAQHAGLESTRTIKYLTTLGDLRLVSRHAPVGSGPNSRDGRWQIDDPFLRFWFRFVFPHQADLESGLAAEDLYDSLIADDVADHCAPIFEAWALTWLREHRASTAVQWGRWWGPAAVTQPRGSDRAVVGRTNSDRTSEEIDAVGLRRGRVTAVGECRWTTTPMTPSILRDLEEFKIPALRKSNLKVVAQPEIILFCKAGYSPGLVDAAANDPRITLVDVQAALA